MSSNVTEAIDEKPGLASYPAKTRLKLSQLVLQAAAGLISGLDGLSFSIAVASLLFAGSLAAGLHLAATAAIISTIVATLAVGIRSSIKTAVGCVQDIGVAILAVTLAATAGSITGPSETRIATAFCIIALATLATGIVLLGTGYFKAGRIVRFFPLEVQAGFMAATGWLLLTGGIAMVTGADATLNAWLSLAQPYNLLMVVPAFALGAIIFLALAVLRKPLTLVALLLLAIAVFHGWRISQGLSIANAAQSGLLPSVDANAALALPFPGLVAFIDWPTVAMAVPAIMMVAVLSLFGVLMNVSALELAGGQDVDVNRELKTAGTSNLLTAMAGGPPGYIDLTASTVCRKLGITVRGTAFAIAAVELIGLIYAGQILAWVPNFVSAGLIIYFGFDLLKDWLVDTRKKFSLREWLVVLIIVLISALYSFILAIVAGFFIATILFAYSYANAPVIRHETTLDRLPSTLDRTPADTAFLVGAGRGVQVVQLQGFLFFGTSEQVVSAVQRAAENGSGSKLNAIVVDFSRVIDMDSASANAFRRIEKLAGARGFDIWYCALNESVRVVLHRTGTDLSGMGVIHVVESLDQALESAETMLIRRRAESGTANTAQLSAQSAAELKALFAAMTRSEHPKGSTVIHAGAEADNVLYIESGRVLISRKLSNGKQQRLRAMLAGALVGEIAFNLGGRRTADVVAEEDTVILSLSADQIRQWERESPELAIAFYRFMARQLADKVVTANRIAEHAAH